MAQHNPQSRGYLLIVLAAIVVCFVIAQLILGGGESDTHTATEAAGGHQMEATDPGHTETMPEEVPPRMEMGGAEMDDGVSPPDEMQEDSSLDGAPEGNP
ncbi:hypothetical protein [Methyloceanibacter sp. wino2]|uniref:hypothetical protein n=1 Tax=Methyloceanibacter sp. wino2 TaxID=2170729 RepID=UPI000D3EE16B|nr:hypothetical protein [Methyloceanibacter sp. wino2]